MTNMQSQGGGAFVPGSPGGGIGSVFLKDTVFVSNTAGEVGSLPFLSSFSPLVGAGSSRVVCESSLIHAVFYIR